MRVSVAYALPDDQWWLDVEVPQGATAFEAINKSGILDIHRDIKLDQQKIGIFGRPITQDTLLCEGDRVEIYRQTTWTPAPDDEDEDD
ncbi:RnfH family protein [Echinimonas agarilytica]|uniref:UPF0125 protein NAF29_12320 n=1 Tax=Echinimonas agarilytica TaxID=1215918 RepID=A0AA41W8I5_9GAMM|nr:RnfH family protein [Echinimonas agarilytica]MCM2680448.1 RnfH family protein [Echinimonas agarilytica]